MEWDESKIMEYINQGWTLSYDKTNQKYKLQKRINGKVKSYTLPKKFNEFCERIKREKEEFNKYLKIFEDIEEDYSVHEIHEKYGIDYEEIEEIFKKYVEWKIDKKKELKDLLAKILYDLRYWEIWKIYELEERLNKASRMVRTAFGFNGINFQCPNCLEISKLKYDNKLGKWICSKCSKIPF